MSETEEKNFGAVRICHSNEIWKNIFYSGFAKNFAVYPTYQTFKFCTKCPKIWYEISRSTRLSSGN